MLRVQRVWLTRHRVLSQGTAEYRHDIILHQGLHRYGICVRQDRHDREAEACISNDSLGQTSSVTLPGSSRFRNPCVWGGGQYTHTKLSQAGPGGAVHTCSSQAEAGATRQRPPDDSYRKLINELIPGYVEGCECLLHLLQGPCNLCCSTGLLFCC